ncbi:efflux RND transporter periplasmic adaptor subunit [Hoeflea sp. G2-23]|uniref:Efflux RND transporter periplasmic adaptor subunit n=1 Tax=Hoeflea algicola TaxID=2983763 RepID=A0ABT3Z9H8_9HYPH|nr:efflux RND transporter periplasmic adaptor subunit [Hoeflea algicola]MCY0148440.1 efflux RND transporter periplasmic adaptor subunit [Hoeflea algicola]
MRSIVIAWAATIAVLGSVPAQGEQPLAVEIVEASQTLELRNFTLTGEIRARESLMASFPVGGRVIEVLAEVGAKVRPDAPLARLDSIQQELAIRTAEAGLTTAHADHRQAIEDLERSNTLLASGTTTRAERDAREDALRAAEGVLDQAEADRDRAIKALADTVLRATSDSTVIKRMIEPGQIIGAAQPAMELALDSGFEAVFDVPEVMLIGKAPDPGILLSRLSSPETKFHGNVTEISPLVDPASGTVTAKVAVLDPPEGLAFGEPVRGTATRDEGMQIGLPYTVVSASAQGPAVWIVDRETMKASLRPVTIDRYSTGKVYLDSGVAEGDWVVARSAQLLYPGRVVRRVEVGQ